MNVAGVGELVDVLRERGVIAADAPAPTSSGGDRPWFITLLQGVAGWLAGAFLLVFIALIFKPDETAAIFLIGFLLLGAAWVIYYADRDAVFLDQFALALSIAGQIAVAWGILKDNQSQLVVAVTLLALQLTILVVMPNRIARTVAALFATIAWLHSVRLLLPPAAPVEWLLKWGPPLALAIWLIRRETAWMASGLREHARPLLTGLLLGLASGGIAAEPFGWFAFGVQGMGAPFTWWALYPLLSIGLAMCAAYGAFRLRSHGLLGFAIFAALLHLSRFYYLYGATLLAKSLIMLCVGVALLALGFWLRRPVP